MSKAKKKSPYNKSPFQLPSHIRYFYQASFLYYINEIAPEIRKAITSFTPQCVKLFGEFPKPPHNEEEFNNLNLLVREVFECCISPDTRESYGSYSWFPILRKNDEELNRLLEIGERINKGVKEHIESLTEEQLDYYKEIFASDFNKPKESIDRIDLDFSY